MHPGRIKTDIVEGKIPVRISSIKVISGSSLISVYGINIA